MRSLCLADYVSSGLFTHTPLQCVTGLRVWDCWGFFQPLLHIYKKPPPWRGSGWPVHCSYFGKPWKLHWALSCCCGCTDGSLKKFPFCVAGFSWAARGNRCSILSPISYRYRLQVLSNCIVCVEQSIQDFEVLKVGTKYLVRMVIFVKVFSYQIVVV